MPVVWVGTFTYGSGRSRSRSLLLVASQGNLGSSSRLGSGAVSTRGDFRVSNNETTFFVVRPLPPPARLDDEGSPDRPVCRYGERRPS